MVWLGASGKVRGALALVGVLLLGAAVFSLCNRTSSSVSDAQSFFSGGKIEYAKAETFWGERVRSRGGVKAYAELVSSAETLTASQSHVWAHVFGAALYEEEGLDALAVCDDRFAFGCWHQFVGTALAEQGLPILPQLARLCGTSPTSTPCRHGIGHGILAHTGYQLADLHTALTECAAIEGSPHRSGCAEGVFMEYNLQELAAGDELAQPRPLQQSQRYHPCTEVAASYASVCGFELPVWWGGAQATTLTLVELTDWMGDACTSAPSDLMRRGCFQGIGFSIGLAAGFEDTVPLCEQAAHARGDKVFCLSGLVSGEQVVDRSAYEDLCAAAGLTGSDHAYCVTYAQMPESLKDAVEFDAH